MSEPVPPAVRAQLLATEHWSLLATRSQTWSEVMSRIMAQFTFTSAVLVVLALVVQQSGPHEGPFRAVALGLGAAVILTGTLTTMRVHYASHEDAGLVRGMNRLRRAYVDLDPGIEPYLVTGTYDDTAGLSRTYTLGPSRGTTQLLASAAIFSVLITALVVGAWFGLLLAPLGPVVAMVAGAVAGSGYVAAFVVSVVRLLRRYEGEPDTVRFPTPGSPPSGWPVSPRAPQ